MSLIDKIRKARETEAEADGRKFTIRRPTDEEFEEFREAGLGNRAAMMYLVRAFTIGWELTELDLIPGGDGVAVPFDSALFADWVADQPATWAPLALAVVGAYNAHTDKRKAAVKN